MAVTLFAANWLTCFICAGVVTVWVLKPACVKSISFCDFAISALLSAIVPHPGVKATSAPAVNTLIKVQRSIFFMSGLVLEG